MLSDEHRLWRLAADADRKSSVIDFASGAFDCMPRLCKGGARSAPKRAPGSDPLPPVRHPQARARLPPAGDMARAFSLALLASLPLGLQHLCDAARASEASGEHQWDRRVALARWCKGIGSSSAPVTSWAKHHPTGFRHGGQAISCMGFPDPCCPMSVDDSSECLQHRWTCYVFRVFCVRMGQGL